MLTSTYSRLLRPFIWRKKKKSTTENFRLSTHLKASKVLLVIKVTGYLLFIQQHLYTHYKLLRIVSTLLSTRAMTAALIVKMKLTNPFLVLVPLIGKHHVTILPTLFSSGKSSGCHAHLKTYKALSNDFVCNCIIPRIVTIRCRQIL